MKNIIYTFALSIITLFSLNLVAADNLSIFPFKCENDTVIEVAREKLYASSVFAVLLGDLAHSSCIYHDNNALPLLIKEKKSLAHILRLASSLAQNNKYSIKQYSISELLDCIRIANYLDINKINRIAFKELLEKITLSFSSLVKLPEQQIAEITVGERHIDTALMYNLISSKEFYTTAYSACKHIKNLTRQGTLLDAFPCPYKNQLLCINDFIEFFFINLQNYKKKLTVLSAFRPLIKKICHIFNDDSFIATAELKSYLNNSTTYALLYITQKHDWNEFTTNTEPIICKATTINNNKVIMFKNDSNSVITYMLDPLRKIESYNAPKNTINCFDLTVNGNAAYPITGHSNGDIRYWKKNKGYNTFHTQKTYDNPVLHVIYNNAAKRIFSLHKNGMIAFWNTKNRDCIKVIDNGANPSWISSLPLTPDAFIKESAQKNYAAIKNDISSLHVFNLSTGERVLTIAFAGKKNNGPFAFNPEHEKILAVSSSNGNIRLWNILHKKYLALDTPLECPNICYNNSGKRLILYNNEKISIYDITQFIAYTNAHSIGSLLKICKGIQSNNAY